MPDHKQKAKNTVCAEFQDFLMRKDAHEVHPRMKMSGLHQQERSIQRMPVCQILQWRLGEGLPMS